ncbi:MAG: carbohydrate kinase [Bacteroidetes bacterium]|nr:carbohydrate kinase [Bacteroidota bacterium]
MPEKQIEQLFDRISKLHILVLGDVMIDRYLNGRVERVSPEAPVPVVQLTDEENRLGGAANVALNLRALGARPTLVSVIGKDLNGEIFRSLMPENDLQDQGIIQSNDRPTTVKTRVIAQSQHLLRVDRESTHDLNSVDEKNLLDRVNYLIASDKPDLILFQDYNKGVLTKSLIKAVIELAIKNQIPTAVDPKKTNFWAYQGVTLFKPNLKEVRDSLPFDIQADAPSLKKASGHIRKQLQNQHTLITLSEKGLYIDNQQETVLLGTKPRSIADVCGAGDTVISIAAAALAAGAQTNQIAQLANLAGGQVCEKVGVVPVNRDLLIREYLADIIQV